MRVADTRDAGPPVAAATETRIALPAAVGGASAAVLNITAIGSERAGFVTAYRCGDPVPATSNLNFAAHSITPNLAVVAPDATGAVCVRANQSAHVVVDVFGALTGASVAGATRILDTRDAGAAAGAGAIHAVRTTATPGAGVLLNITAVDAGAAGFVTGFPCGGPRPPTANLNVAAGATRGNFAVVTADELGSVCVSANVATNLVVDMLGSLPPDYIGLPSPVRALDSRAG
jgi:hypothetical protein